MSLRTIVARFTPTPIRQIVRDLEAARERRHQERVYAGRSVEEVFTSIWQENVWKAGDSVSGAGSEVAATESIRKAIPRLVRDLGVKVFLDAPCGDFNWMKHVDFGGCRYIGLDVVKAMIEQLQRQYSGPNREFVHGDLVAGPLPKADMVLCRDCLFHLNDEQIMSALRQIKATGAKWLLTTTFPEADFHREGITGGYRDINLARPPYSLGAPKELIDEGAVVGSSRIGARRAVGLWAMADVPG